MIAPLAGNTGGLEHTNPSVLFAACFGLDHASTGNRARKSRRDASGTVSAITVIA